MTSKLGFHIDCNNEYGNQYAKIASCRPALVVALINPNEALKAAPALTAARITVNRHYPAEKTMDGTESALPALNAARYGNMIEPIARLYPTAYFAYWRNEVGDGGDLPYHRDEMIAWIEWGLAHNIKTAVGNFSVGIPGYDRWKVLEPLLVKMETVGSSDCLLNLHSYAFNGYTGNADLEMRPVTVWQANNYASRFPHVKIVIGETAPYEKDDKSPADTGPYKAVGITNQEYFAECKDYDMMLQPYPYILGAAVYQWSRDPHWEAYNIEGPVADSLVTYIANSHTEAPPVPAPAPQPIPVPAPGPITGAGSYQVDNEPIGYMNIRSGPGTNYAIVGRLLHTAIVEISEIQGTWAKVLGQPWFLSTTLLKRVV